MRIAFDPFFKMQGYDPSRIVAPFAEESALALH